MLIQEELARGLVSMTSQTLIAATAMAHYIYKWFPSPESGGSVLEELYAFLPGGQTNTGGAIPNATKMAFEQETTASQYINASSLIHTLVLLLIVWAYCKTLSVYWKALSMAWRLLRGSWEVLQRFGTVVRAVFSRVGSALGWPGNRGRTGLVPIDDLPVPPPQVPPVPHTDTTAARDPSTNPQQQQHQHQSSRQPFRPPAVPPPLLLPPPPGYVWLFYQDPITLDLVPHLVPRCVPPFPLPVVPNGAPLVAPQARPPLESVFVPVSEEATGEGSIARNGGRGSGHRTKLNSSSKDHHCPGSKTGRNLSVSDPPTQGSAFAEVCDGGRRDNIQTETAIERARPTATETGNATNNVEAAADNTVPVANSNCAKSKKRKHGSSSSLSGDGSDDDRHRLSKKQKRQHAKARAKAWAKQTFGTTQH